PGSPGGGPGGGTRHTTRIAASSNSSRSLPRSAMSSLAPKYGEPAPGAPAVPKARLGRSICTAETTAPPDSPPTIQAADPVTVTAAWDTGTWSRPAGSSRLVAELKAQIVDTAEPPAPDWPDSGVVPRPGAGRRAAGLAP